MPGNTTYQATNTSDYRAVAIEMRAEAKWQAQIARLNPLLAVLYESGLNWNANSGVDASGTAMLIPILFDTVQGLTTANYGKTDAQQVPTNYPNYLIIDGVTQARYEWTYTEAPYVVTPSEMQKLKNGKFGDIEEAKLMAFMIKHAKIIDDWLNGNQAGAQNQLQGLQHLLSTANTVGGINQASAVNDWWRVNQTTAIGALTEVVIQNGYDNIGLVTNDLGDPKRPDILLLGNAAGAAVNAYGKVRNFLAPNQRIINAKMTQKYGIINYEYMDMLCVQNQKMPVGAANATEAWMLSSSAFYWQGAKKPKIVRDRINGTMAQEVVASAFQCLGCGFVAANWRGTGITS